MGRQEVRGQRRCVTWSMLAVVEVVVVVVVVASSSRVVEAGAHVALSGREYLDVYSYSATTSYLISVHTLLTKPSYSPQALLECVRACRAASGCVTFVMRPEAHLCYLSSHNRCTNPGTAIINAPGYTTYEMKAVDAADSSITCLASCRGSSTCTACGRPNCQGDNCDECADSCWNLDPLVTATVSLVINQGLVPVSVTCNEEWQLVWNGISQVQPIHTSGTYQMLVLIQYTDEQLQAIFSGVRFTGTYLTVAKFESGTAGNGWTAPFVNRVIIANVESNLRPFFYAPGVVSAGGVESYEEQMARNATTITRGFYWYHANPVYANKQITIINLFIKP